MGDVQHAAPEIQGGLDAVGQAGALIGAYDDVTTLQDYRIEIRRTSGRVGNHGSA